MNLMLSLPITFFNWGSKLEFQIIGKTQNQIGNHKIKILYFSIAYNNGCPFDFMISVRNILAIFDRIYIDESSDGSNID